MRIDLLLEALPVMATGYLGIFIVTGVIIALVHLLTRITGESNQQQVKKC